MPTNIDDLELDEPPTVEPYDVLGVEKTATQDQIKTAYRKAALKWHPDKAKPEDKDAAHTKFQEVALAYAVLSDERRRTRYDNTGRTDESLDIDDDIFNWNDFYRAQFANAVTEDTIVSFTKDYKGSEEERDALLSAYTKYKGDMNKIYQQIMVSNPAVDEDRFRNIINDAIEKEDVIAHPKFTQESQKSIDCRIANANEEAEEAEEHGKKTASKKKASAKGGDSDLSSLAAMIQQRNKARSEDFLDNLAEKYGAAPKKKGKKRAQSPDEPPEEAFERTAKRKTKKSKA
ncbi:DnaJ-domain-containing protein [Aureobasidium sp. EXF-3400]|nr:DnaJ-domain-containing protein [Aureobasidium sp. EXF-12344]KAI4775275.1 DnaJ-domain-containing protein [Aureobasidium sp. EXF-3400]